MKAVNWALKRIVRPRDTVIALGVILESCYLKKSSCFPFLMRIGISGLYNGKNLCVDMHLLGRPHNHPDYQKGRQYSGKKWKREGEVRG
ncbi:uncharacterized protein LOC122304863 isoform X2 [Carya illinoinensis]|uniref:uncharacterized protein LOC122304863 isoform X2 n=1 Tax=Carya illinoinensis TaxID=32201 RepID=UPI001C71B7DC|nr:uncharacterized protein LOC122304863 isoform X2 [Carya illinoinensis]